MRNKFGPAAFILLLTALSSFAQKPAYAELLAKVKGGDTKIDFQALRFAFADDPGTNVSTDPKASEAMIKALNEKNFKEAVKVAEERQKTNFVDMNSHIVASMAYKGLGDEKKAKFHEEVYVGLVNSILKSGDGNSPKTAYVVISVAEEYVLLNALELKRGEQSVMDVDGHKYDLLTVTDKKSGEPGKMYFNIDIVWKGYLKVPKN